MNILGISAFYHDAAAALVRDGEIIAAAQEERFTRTRHDAAFPRHAIEYCLREGGVGAHDLDAVAFYEKPLLKFQRLLETYLHVCPRGLRSFVQAMPLWLKQKLWLPLEIARGIEACGVRMPDELFFPEHHEAHAASAFYPSPFRQAAILTTDGVGEWATSAIGRGEGNTLTLLTELHFPHSLGLLYSAFTHYTGFSVNSGEYKLMGLAPYGEPTYAQRIREHLLDLRDDGSFRMNMDCFGYLDGLAMTNARFHTLFGGPPRKPDGKLTQREADIARSIQDVIEDIVLRMARHARAITGCKQVCLAGGVALNCVANGRLLRSGVFDDIWIQPAAGDAGGALGAALFVWHQLRGNARTADERHDRMHGALLGPAYSDDDICAFLDAHKYPAHKLTEAEWAPTLARLLDEQHVLGLFHGRMEFGPRALGNRSIIGDARSPAMQSLLNLKIKFRESFRPFAPACLVERVGEVFELDRPSPYMLLVAPVQPRRRVHLQSIPAAISERVNQVRSDLPAITHVDYSARVQTVDYETNPRFHDLIKAFEARTGCPVIINTSFNVRDEPIVCSPLDAYRCFMRTAIDYLVLGSYLLDRRLQPEWREPYHRRTGVLD